MIRSAFGFLAGHCLVHSLPELPDPGTWGVLLAAGLLACLFLRWRLVAWGVLGIAWAWVHAALLLARDLPVDLEGQDVRVAGYVASLPESTPVGPRFVLDLRPDLGDAALSSLRRIELTWYDAPLLPRAGELWEFTVRLRRRRGFANPGGFDFEAQLLRERVNATGYVREQGDNRQLAAASARYSILRMRGWVAARLEAALPDSPMLGIIQGLAVGERQNMTSAQWQVFAATGTSHLMAISGLHIAMVAALTAGVGGLMCRLPGMQERRITAVDGRAWGGLAGGALYAVLAGFGIPAQRTLIMLSVFFGARLLRRELTPARGLSLALIVVLIKDPFAPLSVGAWLSFGAVGSIFWLLGGRVGSAAAPGLAGKIRSFLSVQWAVTIGLAPLLLIAFGALSVVSPFVNLLAIPLFTLGLVPLVLVGTASAAFALPLGVPLLELAASILSVTWRVLEAAAASDFATLHLPTPPFWASLLLGTGAVILLAPGFLPARLAGLLLCLPALLYRPDVLAPGAFRLAVLDVGQGLAAVVETRSRVLVYDAGPAFQSGRDTGELVVLPYLRSRGVRRIDALVTSHGDLDHVGGVRSVLAGMPVLRIVAGPSVSLPGVDVEICRSGMSWEWDDVGFSILHPGPDDGGSDNDSSCVLQIRGHGGQALLTGDIGQAVEADLVDRGQIRRARIVVAAHHGSRTSSSASFIAATRPDYVVFAAGYRNRWGFPRPDVVERWIDSGATPLATADLGGIEAEVTDGGEVRVRGWRRAHRRYWHTGNNGQRTADRG